MIHSLMSLTLLAACAYSQGASITPAEQPKAESAAAPAQAPKAVEAPAKAPEIAAPAVQAAVEPAKIAEPAKVPAAEPAKVAEPVKAPEAPVAAPKPAAKKAMTGCAQCVKPLLDSYKEAVADMEKWTRDVDAQTAAAEDAVKQLQEQIQENEAAITKLKLENSKDAKTRSKELAKENKRLWSELEAARKAKAALCKQFARDASQKVREYSTDISAQLKTVQTQMQQQ
ncbi:MAG: hypothetical protein WCU88_08370 [Elusimicrobiota bacterium]|jgi:hypothetical protein